MSYAATVFKVMIATPGDVQEERDIIREVIHEWNAAHSKSTRLVLLPVGWETHSAPAMGDRPQAIINKQILQDCDLLVATFWTRIGTDTGKAPSGTVEEIDEHLAAGKPAMIYFSEAPVVLNSVDQDQYNALVEFNEQCKEQGLIETFSSSADFKSKFTRQLQATVSSTLLSQVPTVELMEEQLTHQTNLSQDAQRLLVAAAEEGGYILYIRMRSGTEIGPDGKNFCEDNSAREVARWKSALEELYATDAVEDPTHKGEVFKVTHLGYQVVDQLKEQ